MVNSERLPRDIVVVGASAGGVTALRRLFAALPIDFRGVVAAVMHRSPYFESNLPMTLGRNVGRDIVEPSNGQRLERGCIYVAPRDRHLLFHDGRLHVTRGPKQHHTRPAVDPLFQSAAEAYGPRVVGVVLTGGGDDGVDGLIAIKAARGLSIVQDPREATHPFMPANAVKHDDVDLVLPLDDIARVLVALAAGQPVPTRQPA